MSWLRRVVDAEEAVTAAQLAFAVLFVAALVIVAAAGVGFAVRIYLWAS